MRLRMADSALIVGTVTFLASYVGDSAAISAGGSVVAFSSILYSMHNPRPAIRLMVSGTAIGVLVPTAQLGLGIAFINAGVLLRAHIRIVILSIKINVCFLLALGLGTAAPPLVIAVTSSAAIFVNVALVAGLLHVLLQLHGPTENL